VSNVTGQRIGYDKGVDHRTRQNRSYGTAFRYGRPAAAEYGEYWLTSCNSVRDEQVFKGLDEACCAYAAGLLVRPSLGLARERLNRGINVSR